MIQKCTAKDNIFSSIRPPPEDRRCFKDAHPEYGSPGSPGRSRCSGAGGPRPGCGPPPGSGPEWAGCRSPPLRGYGLNSGASNRSWTKISRKQGLWRSRDPHRPPCGRAPKQEAVEIWDARPGRGLAVSVQIIPAQVPCVVHDPRPGVQALGGKAGAVSPHPPVIIVPGISVIGPAVGIGHRRRPVISQQMFHARSPPSHRSMSGEARRCLGRNETSPAI